MENGSERELYRSLGQIESSLKTLTQSIESFKTESTTSRAKTHDSLKLLTQRTAELESKADRLRDDIDAMKPLADEARRWRERGIGAAFGFSSMGALFGGVIVAFGDRVKAFLNLGG